jgi:hypothetical protein
MSPIPHILATIAGLCTLPAALSMNFGFSYGSQKVRGVNLGGWLVLEVRHARRFQQTLIHDGWYS